MWQQPVALFVLFIIIYVVCEICTAARAPSVLKHLVGDRPWSESIDLAQFLRFFELVKPAAIFILVLNVSAFKQLFRVQSDAEHCVTALLASDGRYYNNRQLRCEFYTSNSLNISTLPRECAEPS